MNILPDFLATLMSLSMLTPADRRSDFSGPSVSSQQDYCYSTDNSRLQRQHYSLQTPHPPDLSGGCYPVKIWLVTRHGTRYPSQNDINGLEKSLPAIQDSVTPNEYLCEQDYDLLKSWSMNDDVTPCSLTTQGFDDLSILADSYRTIYPTLFDNAYSPETYTFAHSSAERTVQSCAAFASALFGTTPQLLKSLLYWTTNNLMLRPWMECPLFDQNAESLRNPNSEPSRFRNSTHYYKVLHHVSRRLGLNQLLNDELISHMWDECRYQETYHLNRLSPWCAAFDLHEATVLEYLSDLELYYKLSYGNGQLNGKLPCVAIKDMLTSMEDDTTPNKVTAYFSHAELLTMIITALGAYQDEEPLMADNYERMKNRQFRTSNWVPYASNIAAVKYNCPAYDEPDSVKILMLQNQQPFAMSWCRDGSVCTLEEMQNMFYNSTMSQCPYGICGQQFAETEPGSKAENVDSC